MTSHFQTFLHGAFRGYLSLLCRAWPDRLVALLIDGGGGFAPCGSRTGAAFPPACSIAIAAARLCPASGEPDRSVDFLCRDRNRVCGRGRGRCGGRHADTTQAARRHHRRLALAAIPVGTVVMARGAGLPVRD